MSRCAIALGGNIGPTAEHFDRAFGLLEQSGYQLIARSRNHETRPMGAQAGATFLNAAAVLQTQRDAPQVLQDLHATEAALGRERSVHWGPRIIDLDLLLYDDLVVDRPELVVPHPQMWYRRFVLEPLVEIAASWQHPLLQTSVQLLFERLSERPLRLLLNAQDVLPLQDQTFLSQLQNDLGPEFELRIDSLAQDAASCFARIDCVAASGSAGADRTQPALASDRSIKITVGDADDVRQQVRDIAAAIVK